MLKRTNELPYWIWGWCNLGENPWNMTDDDYAWFELLVGEAETWN